MRVFMIGGTGLLGSQAAAELIKRGHQVVSIALPGMPKGANIPEKMELHPGNYMEMKDEEIVELMKGCEGFVFAAGVDERVEAAPPIYDMFKKYNIDALERLLRLAKSNGVKHVAICGSYFSYAVKKWPELNLVKYHPYMRSRIDQEKMALAFADKDFDVAILELPYIFGAQKGRKPVWVFLVEMIRGMKDKTYYTKGGTAMVTVKQVGEGLAGALERNKGGNTYPFGYYNMEWKEFFKIVHKYMGLPESRPVITVPSFLYSLSARKIMKQREKEGLDSGLNLVKFAKVQTRNLFIDKDEGSVFLGVQPDDVDKAIGESIQLSIDIINRKSADIVDMKKE
ncbi:MAG TPA: NAD(P)-dependent oxidoreductase [Bacilli bacterium]|nr:NAD(P)-dependent oxidoreductase [Bacilli bacterium]